MATTLIKLAYRQIIDASSTSSFERNVFQATYHEFKLKSQTYNQEGKFKTFTELKANDGRANSLHYKISFAAEYFIAELKNKIPVLTDNVGTPINFDVASFELIESDLTNKDMHQLAINYSTGTLTLCDIVGEYLIVAKGEVSANQTIETFTIKMQPNLAISEFHIQDQQAQESFIPLHTNSN